MVHALRPTICFYSPWFVRIKKKQSASFYCGLRNCFVTALVSHQVQQPSESRETCHKAQAEPADLTSIATHHSEFIHEEFCVYEVHRGHGRCQSFFWRAMQDKLHCCFYVEFAVFASVFILKALIKYHFQKVLQAQVVLPLCLLSAPKKKKPGHPLHGILKGTVHQRTVLRWRRLGPRCWKCVRK